MPTTRQHYHSVLLPACNRTEQQVKDEDLAVGIHDGANGQFQDVDISHASDMKPKHAELGDLPMENEALKRQLEDAEGFYLNHSDLTCRQRQALIGETMHLREEEAKLEAQGSPTPAATASFIGANGTFRQLPKQLLKQSICTNEEFRAKSKALQRAFGDAEGNEGSRMRSCEACSIADFSTSDEESSPVHSGSIRVSESDFMENDEDGECSSESSHIHSSTVLQENPPMSFNGNDEQWEWRKHQILDIQDRIRLRDAKLSERRSRRQPFECVE